MLLQVFGVQYFWIEILNSKSNHYTLFSSLYLLNLKYASARVISRYCPQNHWLTSLHLWRLPIPDGEGSPLICNWFMDIFLFFLKIWSSEHCQILKGKFNVTTKCPFIWHPQTITCSPFLAKNNNCTPE